MGRDTRDTPGMLRRYPGMGRDTQRYSRDAQGIPRAAPGLFQLLGLNPSTSPTQAQRCSGDTTGA